MATTPPKGHQLLKPSKVSKVLDCHRNYVYTLVSLGELKAIRIGEKCLRIAQADLDNFIEARRA